MGDQKRFSEKASWWLWEVRKNSCIKGGAYYCYCAYVLRISRYLGFPIGDAFKYSDLCKYHWYPKRKYGVTMHFWEIITLPFEKERHTLLCILNLFTDIIHELSLKNAWLPQFSFWISIALVTIYISCIIINRGKNHFELVGTVLNRICSNYCTLQVSNFVERQNSQQISRRTCT